MVTSVSTPEITPAMIRAGWDVFDRLRETYPAYALVAEIYKAMWLHRLGETGETAPSFDGGASAE